MYVVLAYHLVISFSMAILILLYSTLLRILAVRYLVPFHGKMEQLTRPRCPEEKTSQFEVLFSNIFKIIVLEFFLDDHQSRTLDLYSQIPSSLQLYNHP